MLSSLRISRRRGDDDSPEAAVQAAVNPVGQFFVHLELYLAGIQGRESTGLGCVGYAEDGEYRP